MNSAGLPRIVIICGPTGIGKTAFAITLAKRFGAEIVGADSMQIYRRLDVGTAKPTPAERAAVRHHMVDIVDPDEAFDASAYGRLAHETVQQLAARTIPAFVVGGTGLYIKALVHGLFEGHASDHHVRAGLQTRLQAEGAAALHADLTAKDPAAAARIHPNDTYRILRALEVIETSGRSMSEFHQVHGFQRVRCEALNIGLTMPRDHLYTRIDRRVDRMIAAGLLDEVRGLLSLGYDPNLKSLQSLGYRHMIGFLQERTSWEEALRTLKRDHRRYAKRQFTWFKAVPGMNWLAPDQLEAAAEMVADFLSGGS